MAPSIRFHTSETQCWGRMCPLLPSFFRDSSGQLCIWNLTQSFQVLLQEYKLLVDGEKRGFLMTIYSLYVFIHG